MASPFDVGAFTAAFALPGIDGTFTGPFGDYLRALGTRRPSVILAFPPKTGGTFLRAAAVKAVDGQLTRMVHAQGGRDAQFYLPYFIGYYLAIAENKTVVTHVHMLALPANRNFIEAFDLKPAIMVRSIPDMLASYMDMLEADDMALEGGLNCRFPPNYRNLPRETKADFAVDILAPWYANYYATWFEFAAESPGRVLVLDYEDFARTPARVLERTLAHAGLPTAYERCDAAVQSSLETKQELRFNRGEVGRGKSYFFRDQLARIAKLLSYYPVLKDIAPKLVA
jgi:hypothetical protein